MTTTDDLLADISAAANLPNAAERAAAIAALLEGQDDRITTEAWSAHADSLHAQALGDDPPVPGGAPTDEEFDGLTRVAHMAATMISGRVDRGEPTHDLENSRAVLVGWALEYFARGDSDG